MERKAKIRSLLIGLFFSLFALYIIGKLYYVQVVEADMLQARAADLWTADQTIPAKRGLITDRNGNPLAEDTAAYTVSVAPDIINERGLANDISQGLASILAATPADVSALQQKIYGLATKKNDAGKYLMDVQIRNEGWKINGDTKQKIDAFVASLGTRTGYKNVGIYLREEKSRFYPNDALAAHVIGFVDKEGAAKSGIELQYDNVLKGTDGKLVNEQDSKGIELPDSNRTYIPAVNGNTVRLTLDQHIQFFVENAVQQAFDQWKPQSISVIVSDPRNMDILGMASYPTFNPNQYWEYAQNPKSFLNRTISWPYEPGSTFKLVTLAGTIQEGLFDPNGLTPSGTLRIPNSPAVHDYNSAGWGNITFMEGLLRSSNVAFVKLAMLLGTEKQLDYIHKFGFGEKTGIDLPDEKPGDVNLKYPSDFARAAFGQGNVTVTAIQLTAAYAAIANGGKLMTPHIVKDIVNPDTGDTVQSFPPQVVRQVVSPETAKQATLDLEQVVANQDIGTGKKAFINGYRVAGKTGTANIVPDGAKAYSSDTWLISFVGFAPVEDPQIEVTIMIDQPDLKGDFHKGSEAWAPMFQSIMTQSLSYLGIAPSSTAQTVKSGARIGSLAEPVVQVPDVSGMSVAQAKNVLTQRGLKTDVLGGGDKVLSQFPEAGSQISLQQQMYVKTEADSGSAIPDMTGKSLREALEMCSLLGVPCVPDGDGYVVSQSVTGDGNTRTVSLQLKPLDSQNSVPASPPPAAPSAKAQDNPAPGSSAGAGKSAAPTPAPASGKKTAAGESPSVKTRQAQPQTSSAKPTPTPSKK